MVQAAAAVAKAATTTAAVGGAEALPAAVNIATTVPKVVETAAQTATAAGEIAGGLPKAVEAVKVVEVAPEAAQAAAKIDLAVKNETAIPEIAMNDLVSSPAAESSMNTTTAEASQIAAEWADQKHTEILRSVQPQMVEWENSHPIEPATNVQEWMEQRAAAEKQFTVDEAVNRDIEEWKFHNPEPDQTKDKAAHEDWVKQFAAKQAQSRQENEASYEQFLAQQQEKNQGMSKQEFMRRYARLLQLRAITDKYAMNLQRLRVSAHKTPEYKAALAQAEAQLESQRAQIELLEGELQFDAIKSGSVWKQWIIPAAVGASMAAGAMAGPANEV